MEKRIVTLTGLSSCGKSVLINGSVEALEARGKHHFAQQAWSYCTRPLRGPEDHRKAISVLTFLEMKKNNEFIESTIYNSEYYAIAKHTIEEILAEGVALIDADLRGITQIRAYAKAAGYKVVSVYVCCTASDLYARQVCRGAGSPADRLWRLQHSLQEVEDLLNGSFDFIIFNGGDLSSAVAKLVSIIENPETARGDILDIEDFVATFKRDMESILANLDPTAI